MLYICLLFSLHKRNEIASANKLNLSDQKKITKILAQPDHQIIPSSDSEDDSPPDFDYLLSFSSSHESHFLLKAEQQKFNQRESVQLSKHFNLDTNILNLAVRSIPFNERHEDLKILWNSQEVRQMKEEAASFEEVYYQSLQKSCNKETPPINRSLQQTDESTNKAALSEAKISSAENKGEKESIQEWLDDILDL